jgi:DNA-3-methyladenine glycosylase I
VRYHDDDWGRPAVDDRRLLEKIALEGFQSGLSWMTILRKRENFRRAFAGFDPAVISTYGESDVERLLGDAGIIRHRGKIEATINNAQRCLEVQQEFGSLASYVWTFESDTPGGTAPPPSQSAASVALSKDLKRRGWRFVGPTTVYAFMQAMGLVNDHIEGCEWRAICAAERTALRLP